MDCKLKVRIVIPHHSPFPPRYCFSFFLINNYPSTFFQKHHHGANVYLFILPFKKIFCASLEWLRWSWILQELTPVHVLVGSKDRGLASASWFGLHSFIHSFKKFLECLLICQAYRIHEDKTLCLLLGTSQGKQPRDEVTKSTGNCRWHCKCTMYQDKSEWKVLWVYLE